MEIKVIPLFPVLVNYIEMENFSKYQSKIIHEIDSFMNSNDGVTFSNRRGYQSPPNFYLKHNSFLKYIKLFEKELTKIKSFYSNKKIKINHGWFNVNFPGSYNVSHTHPTSSLNAIWWIKIPPNSGDLFIESPYEFTQHKVINNMDYRIRDQFNIHNSYRIEPKEGTILLFPSDMKHFVEENCSLENRISLAFNLDFEENDR